MARGGGDLDVTENRNSKFALNGFVPKNGSKSPKLM